MDCKKHSAIIWSIIKFNKAPMYSIMRLAQAQSRSKFRFNQFIFTYFYIIITSLLHHYYVSEFLPDDKLKKDKLRVWAGASLMMLYIGALLKVMKLQMIAECFLQSIKVYLI